MTVYKGFTIRYRPAWGGGVEYAVFCPTGCQLFTRAAPDRDEARRRARRLIDFRLDDRR